MSKIEFSTAITAHLAWKTRVRAAVRSGEFKEVCLDSHACQLGKWLDASNGQVAYRDLYKLHAEVHRLCGEVTYDTKDAGRLAQWEEASDKLIAMLQALKDASA